MNKLEVVKLLVAKESFKVFRPRVHQEVKSTNTSSSQMDIKINLPMASETNQSWVDIIEYSDMLTNCRNINNLA